MKMEELAKEFILDCKVRNLAPRTVRNYEKQLAYFLRFLKETEDVETLEELKPIHIKKFIAMLQGKKNKPSCSFMKAIILTASTMKKELEGKIYSGKCVTAFDWSNNRMKTCYLNNVKDGHFS